MEYPLGLVISGKTLRFPQPTACQGVVQEIVSEFKEGVSFPLPVKVVCTLTPPLSKTVGNREKNGLNTGD